jgi:hypothetical protein
MVTESATTTFENLEGDHIVIVIPSAAGRSLWLRAELYDRIIGALCTGARFLLSSRTCIITVEGGLI